MPKVDNLKVALRLYYASLTPQDQAKAWDKIHPYLLDILNGLFLQYKIFGETKREDLAGELTLFFLERLDQVATANNPKGYAFKMLRNHLVNTLNRQNLRDKVANKLENLANNKFKYEYANN